MDKIERMKGEKNLLLNGPEDVEKYSKLILVFSLLFCPLKLSNEY